MAQSYGKPLTKENLLNEQVFSNLDTWPFLPIGEIGQSIEAVDQEQLFKQYGEYSENLQRLNKITDDFVNRQRNLLSWLLAASMGFLGSLAVNFAFNTPFSYSGLSITLLIITVAIVILLGYTIFKVYPTNCTYKVDILQPFVRVNNFPSLQTSKLTIKAKTLFATTDSDYNLSSLNELLLKYASLVSLAILRDKLRVTNLTTIHVSSIENYGQSIYSPYLTKFDLKGR